MRGKIIACINHGSVVQILLRTEKDLGSIVMDHRSFWNMIQVKQDIVGKEVECNEEGRIIVFTEDLVG